MHIRDRKFRILYDRPEQIDDFPSESNEGVDINNDVCTPTISIEINNTHREHKTLCALYK